MIRIYGMPSCPDCRRVEEQAEGKVGYEIIDIGSDVRRLKEFLRLRDASPVFDEAKRKGSVGIPCFVLDDGRVTLVPEDAGLKSRPEAFATGGASKTGFAFGGDPGAGTVADSRGASGTDTGAAFSEGAACSLDGKGC